MLTEKYSHTQRLYFFMQTNSQKPCTHFSCSVFFWHTTDKKINILLFIGLSDKEKMQ